jgi:hypothetical protein
MTPLVYIEYIHPIKDYFSTVKVSELLFDWAAPLAITLLLYKFTLSSIKPETVETINGYSINLLAILVGFSIASLTILTANNSKNIEDLKEHVCQRMIRGRPVTLYRLIVLNFIFLIIMEFAALLYSFGFLFIIQIDPIKAYSKEIFIVSIFLISHVFFLNIRNVTNFYFVISREL